MKKRVNLRSRSFSTNLTETLRYFGFFHYAPTDEELYLFYPQKISQKSFQKQVKREVLNKKIKKYYYDGHYRYTVGGYGSKQKAFFLSDLKKKNITSKIKTQKVQRYIDTLSRFSQIKLIGFSGSVSMMNAKRDDDIDLFLITDKNRMFTARFIGLFLAILMGLKRKRNTKKAQDKVCLNLFFDALDLQIPPQKRSEYVAHEVLQMKPVTNKENTYVSFLRANPWVQKLYPNSIPLSKVHMSPIKKKGGVINCLIVFGGNLIEWCMRRMQLLIINKHKTSELITSTQLWFFPDDFEKKIKN